MSYRVLKRLREQDLNLRPLGYEPNELPDCSIPRFKNLVEVRVVKIADRTVIATGFLIPQDSRQSASGGTLGDDDAAVSSRIAMLDEAESRLMKKRRHLGDGITATLCGVGEDA